MRLTNFVTSVHRKSTFSGVFTNLFSFVHKHYKFGLVSTLLHRSFTICSNDDKFKQEVELLKQVFRKNAYPSSFIDRCVNLFHKKLLLGRRVCFDVPKKEITIVLTFLGKLSLEIRTRLVKIISSKLFHAQLKVIFPSPTRLRNIFSVKDLIPNEPCSYGLYR